MTLNAGQHGSDIYIKNKYSIERLLEYPLPVSPRPGYNSRASYLYFVGTPRGSLPNAHFCDANCAKNFKVGP